jgi:hypothetical protein
VAQQLGQLAEVSVGRVTRADDLQIYGRSPKQAGIQEIRRT